MKLFVLSLLLGTLAVGILADETAHQTEIRKVEERLDRLAHRALTIEDNLDARRDPARLRKAGSLKYHIQRLEGTKCRTDQFQCDGNDNQCVNNLLVCDGHKDCRNGADENDCKLPFKVGDVFDGSVVYDNCNMGALTSIGFAVRSAETTAFFTPIAKLKIDILLTKDSDTSDYDSVLFSKAFYEFATHRIVVAPTSSNRLGLVCRFDGSDYDHCIGYTVQESTLERCAKYTFTRKDA